MIKLLVDRPTDLLAVRFATSPIWETMQAVRIHGRDCAPETPSWRKVLAANVERLDLAPLLALNPRAGYTPDFLTPPPTAAAPRFRSQLAELRQTPLPQIEKELRLSLAQTLAADTERRAQVARLLADPAAARLMLAELVDQAWRALVAPLWPRIRALLSADIAYRARALAEHGLLHVIDALDPRIRWAGSAVTVDAAGEVEIELDQRGVVLMPSAYVWPGVAAITDEPWQPTIVYPARGIEQLWQSDDPPIDSLVVLLGRTRARVLAALDSPASTTDLAARLDLTPSGVSRHVIALRDAGLLATSRHGHEIRYSRTRLAGALLRANSQR